MATGATGADASIGPNQWLVCVVDPPAPVALTSTSSAFPVTPGVAVFMVRVEPVPKDAPPT